MKVFKSNGTRIRDIKKFLEKKNSQMPEEDVELCEKVFKDHTNGKQK